MAIPAGVNFSENHCRGIRFIQYFKSKIIQSCFDAAVNEHKFFERTFVRKHKCICIYFVSSFVRILFSGSGPTGRTRSESSSGAYGRSTFEKKNRTNEHSNKSWTNVRSQLYFEIWLYIFLITVPFDDEYLSLAVVVVGKCSSVLININNHLLKKNQNCWSRISSRWIFKTKI